MVGVEVVEADMVEVHLVEVVMAEVDLTDLVDLVDQVDIANIEMKVEVEMKDLSKSPNTPPVATIEMAMTTTCTPMVAAEMTDLRLRPQIV